MAIQCCDSVVVVVCCWFFFICLAGSMSSLTECKSYVVNHDKVMALSFCVCVCV